MKLVQHIVSVSLVCVLAMSQFDAEAANTTSEVLVISTSPGCQEVSVERDATYCITGTICSGSGVSPAGNNCPKRGDIATNGCRDTLKTRQSSGSCVMFGDSICQKIATGAWGCVLPPFENFISPNSTRLNSTEASTVNASTNLVIGSTAKAESKVDNETIQFPTPTTTIKTLSVATNSSESTDVNGTATVVGVVAAAAATICIAAAAVMQRRKNRRQNAAMEQALLP